MPETPIQASLTPSEWHLIEAIRTLPDSPLRNRTHQVLGQLLFFIQNPRCQGIGAEGFPCGEPASTCQECHQVWDLLDIIAARVTQG